MAADMVMEPAEVFSAGDRHREGGHHSLATRTRAFVHTRHDAESQKRVLHVFSQPMRCGVVRCMVGVRDMTIAIPQPCEQQTETGRVELEHRVWETLRVRIEAPYAEPSRPFHRSDRSRGIPATDVYAVAVSMAADGRSGVVESLDRTDELVTVLHIGRIEVERAGVAQVSFRDEPGEHDQLMPTPSRESQRGQRPRCGDMIAHAELAELPPSRDGEKRMFGGGRDPRSEERRVGKWSR